MKWNKLLEKQIRKYLPGWTMNDPESSRFLQAINDSYNAYERDLLLSERAFRISEEEYISLNTQLLSELEVKKISIIRLKEALTALDPESISGASDDLLDIVNLFKNQIERRNKTEEELTATAQRLTILISNLHSGILVEDENRRIALVNEYFCRLFGIAAPPELLLGMDCSGAAEQSKHMFRQPDKFVDRIQQILNNKAIVTDDELELTDGRFFERDYIPIFIDDVYRGHLWKYREITDRKNSERKLKESEELWQFALEGAGDGVWEYNFLSRKAFFSRQYKKMLGFEEDEFPDEREAWRSRVHPDDVHLIGDAHEKYMSGEMTAHRREYRIRHKNGNYIWLLDRGMVVAYTAEGKPERIVGTHTDITERKLAEQAIRIKEEKYRNIIANMNLGLLEVSLDDKIIFANQSFCDMSGYMMEELEGKCPTSILTFGDNLEVITAKNKLRQKGISDAYEVAVKNKRGELKWWLISGAPIYDSSGVLSGTIGIHLDITEQKKLEFELKEARLAAEQSGQAKETFLANMSHEIRTPMNAILGMSRQLAKTQLNDTQSVYLKTINTATDHLMVVINDILDISKIEAGKMSIQNIAFRPQELLKNVLAVMRPRADEKGLRLQLYVETDFPSVLSGDPYRINQILLNLISNSIKFTDKGSVEIRCSSKAFSDSKYRITFSIADTGVGIESGFIPHIFDKFSQEYRSITRRSGGTGLGMAICKQLVELMGGEIAVLSEPGKGTEVTFTIPLFSAREVDLEPNEKKQVDYELLRGARILLAEDNEMNRLVVQTVLKDYGVVLTEVADGRAALDCLASNVFDIVLMDIQMPVMNGLEATMAIRKELNLDVPVIALTANAIKGESDRCLAVGMSDFISKPFEEEELVNAIAGWLRGVFSDPDLRNANSRSEAAAPLYSLDKLEKIGNSSKSFMHKMLTLFLEQVPRSVAEIEAAYQHGDCSIVRSIAHRIKPTLDSMDISSLKEPIRFLEQISERSKDADDCVELLKNNINKVGEDVKKRLTDFE